MSQQANQQQEPLSYDEIAAIQGVLLPVLLYDAEEWALLRPDARGPGSRKLFETVGGMYVVEEPEKKS